MIPKDWEIRSLKDVADVLTGFPFKSKNYSLKEGTLVARGENLSYRKFRWDTPKRWKMTDETIKKYLLKENMPILAMDGSVGQNKAVIRKNDLPLLIAQRVAAITAKKDECQEFINQVLMSDLFFKYCEQIKTGTTIAHISKGQIEEFRIPYPNEIKEQKSIAKILSNLDEKIELNQIINKTLEAIGQAIFKHWFVDFEFPNEEGKPYKSLGGEMVYNKELGKEIPKEWRVKPIDEIADFLNGLALQKFPAKENEEYLPVIKIRELKQGISESSDKANFSVPTEYIVDDGDILFSWSGSLEVVIWGHGKGALNQHLFKVTSNNYPKWLFYNWIIHYLPQYRHIAEGKATTMGHIQRHHLKDSLVVVPDRKKLESMNKVLSPLIDRIVEKKIELRTLSQFRDLLLPKLMSGKIRVPLEVK
jgi:type I restriction enzyme S subunit